MKRKNVNLLTNELINDVQESIECGGENRGYRNIRQPLILKGKPYTFNSVRLALKSVDPNGVARRSKHRLKRRKCINCGPNYVWHIDRNNKLKPFGFCIHAGIDGFSRKILWLKVSYTNKDPLAVCQYYLDAITTLGALPKKVRADKEKKTWTFVQFRHSLEKIMLTRLVVTVVFSMVSLSQTKELKLGGQS